MFLESFKNSKTKCPLCGQRGVEQFQVWCCDCIDLYFKKDDKEDKYENHK